MHPAAKGVELVILVGIQASGKTTFYRRHLAEGYAHVSLDRWRGQGNVRSKEHRAIMEGLRAAAQAAAGVRGVVVDNTNITAQARRRYFDYAAEFAAAGGCPVRLTAYFFDAALDGCLRRNQERPTDAPRGSPYRVPPPAIVAFRRRLERPTHQEGFHRLCRVSIDPQGNFLIQEEG
jgi:predicted kinase